MGYQYRLPPIDGTPKNKREEDIATVLCDVLLEMAAGEDSEREDLFLWLLLYRCQKRMEDRLAPHGDLLLEGEGACRMSFLALRDDVPPALSVLPKSSRGLWGCTPRTMGDHSRPFSGRRGSWTPKRGVLGGKVPRLPQALQPQTSCSRFLSLSSLPCKVGV